MEVPAAPHSACPGGGEGLAEACHTCVGCIDSKVTADPERRDETLRVRFPLRPPVRLSVSGVVVVKKGRDPSGLRCFFLEELEFSEALFFFFVSACSMII